jgi:oxaloacetate decarboxylase alpha subunit
VTNGSHPEAVLPAAPALSPAAVAAPPVAPAEADAGLLPVKSPMVGTFYRAPAPDAEAYVEIGDVVEPGQTVCIIEAMKLMNEIQSESRGKVVKIMVENSQPVEFGQTLFLLQSV